MHTCPHIYIQSIIRVVKKCNACMCNRIVREREGEGEGEGEGERKRGEGRREGGREGTFGIQTKYPGHGNIHSISTGKYIAIGYDNTSHLE